MEQKLLTKKDAVKFFLNKNILLSSDFKDLLATLEVETLYNKISEKIKSQDFLVMNNDLRKLLASSVQLDINWFDLEKSRTLLEKGKNREIYHKFVQYLTAPDIKKKPIKVEDIPEIKKESSVKVIFSYNQTPRKREIQDFVHYFNARFNSLEKILKNRQELKNLTSIARITNKKDRSTVSVIGLVRDKETTKNQNIILTLEDPTGTTKALINKNKPELLTQAKTITQDEVIAVMGVNAENIIFANKILWPDVPANKELKKSPDEAYAIFLSDIHIGSTNFLPEDFQRFLKWLNGQLGNEKQKEIAKKIKYAFIVGDLVDGIGVYPGQDKELAINDIYEQYTECAKLLKQIPKNIQLIICPGNHDAVRMAEPQPALSKEFSKPLYNLPNATFVSNPAIVNIHSSESFSGFDVLIYHGYSFDHYVANVDTLRNQGGYNRADLIMRFLLKRRHLSPTHTATLYVPDTKTDPLLIEKIPDFFVTGHIHKSIAANYRNITLLSGSCWQSKTSFQERVGHTPEPSRVPIVNLQTREIKILRFGKS